MTRLLALFVWTTSVTVCFAQKEKVAVPWTARPDPLPLVVPMAQSTDKSITLGKTGDVIFPSGTSPFACAVIPAGAKMPPELRLMDLTRFEQVGQSLKLEGVGASHLRLSPYGDYLAAVDSKADLPSVKVWSFDGKAPRTIVIHDAKLRIEALDFLTQGKILTVKELRDVKKNFFQRLYEVWDIETGKKVGGFHYQLEYDIRWVGYSPGRHYIAMEENTNDGYSFLLWDWTSGKLAGKLEVQPKKDGFGIAAGITFSPDGKEAALLWRQGGDGMYAKVQRFDIEKGVKKGEHILREDIKPSTPGFTIGGMHTFQFLPDGRGRLVSGHQIVDRETGKVVWKLGIVPGTKYSTQDRRFTDAYHVTTTGDKKFAEKKLTITTLPKTELDAAFEKARMK